MLEKGQQEPQCGFMDIRTAEGDRRRATFVAFELERLQDFFVEPFHLPKLAVEDKEVQGVSPLRLPEPTQIPRQSC